MWGIFGFVPAYRNFYWDYLGRRVAWKDSFKNEDDKKKEAENLKADWGFHPRYEVKYPFSINRLSYYLPLLHTLSDWKEKSLF